eukprot:CAMPEP_0115473388 /NCGR_PEP_ID=MMETSP0271-20121206/53541_1 /TAXON_ID=71861 /ORGANISM="Scrippsiella trochoidea, Strain CCMP3099" /LENGTH=233 /DNA_ID=CAMNT_0002900659 /DNA_START=325 /DNA_END=1026 /DNA_ORIENTATION=-
MASRADAQEANHLVGIAARLVPWLSLARVANCCGIQGGGRGNIDVPPRDHNFAILVKPPSLWNPTSAEFVSAVLHMLGVSEWSRVREDAEADSLRPWSACDDQTRSRSTASTVPPLPPSSSHKACGQVLLFRKNGCWRHNSGPKAMTTVPSLGGEADGEAGAGTMPKSVKQVRALRLPPRQQQLLALIFVQQTALGLAAIEKCIPNNELHARALIMSDILIQPRLLDVLAQHV